MKRVLRVLLLLLLPGFVFAQNPTAIRNFSSSTVQADPVALTENGSYTFHQLAWTGNGTLSTCQVKLEKSPDGTTWSDLIAAQTCTSTGRSAIVTDNANFVRINVTTISGGGTLSTTYFGNLASTSSFIQGGSSSGTSNAGINPILVACDASGGNVSANQISNIKCGTNGSILTLITQTASDGVGNTFAGAMSAPGGAGLNLEIWPFIFNGVSWDRLWYCPNKARLNALGAATTQIVALSGATKIRVCSATISNNNATATTLKMVEGTGANCATGQTDVTALMNFGATSTVPTFLKWGNDGPLVTTTGGDALCFTSSAASSLEITITYDQH